MAGHGRQGWARVVCSGEARLGKAGEAGLVMLSRGEEWSGSAGEACLGEARLGKAG